MNSNLILALPGRFMAYTYNPENNHRISSNLCLVQIYIDFKGINFLEIRLFLCYE